MGEFANLKSYRFLSFSIMSQQSNSRLSAEAAADRLLATRDEVLALLAEAHRLGDANITTWFQARAQPLVRYWRMIVNFDGFIVWICR